MADIAATAAREVHYPCDRCGADLRFAPGQTSLVCDHCGHLQQIAAPAAPEAATGLRELALKDGLAADLPPGTEVEARTTHCPNCGALVEFAGDRHASECPFCATPVIVDTGTHRAIKPQALIPFALTEEAARAALGRWLKSRWFAPSGLGEFARKGRRMQGIYTPFWTFDADTRSRYAGQRGDAYYTTRTVRRDGKTRTIRERHIRWRPVQGTVARRFDDVLVLGSTSLPKPMTDALAPWDLAALVPWRDDYLSGFLAEGYTVPLAAAHGEAREAMARVIASDVRADIGGDEQRVTSVDTVHQRETFKHVLLPVWVAAYKYRGESYRCVVNGQTGKVDGERPWSPWKIALAVLLALAVAAAVYALSR
ncbi:primosomal protein N' (replication factor Y) - superfamily II helicase [Frigidibacter oleivorans]|uniref:primosomal protein N' (replication factor Y) - superfamily II helicase n=1 Tax=Frigidibacter oleivorans TaxID=2487129 RepID=UPI001F36B083|nr:primosomal protein N' (replication factor Y) - superfamily II helicase [Frigidibacter oleivorans]